MAKINLGRKQTKSDIQEPAIPSVDYPSVYIHDLKLPLDPEEVGDVLEAKVKMMFTGIREGHSLGGSDMNYDFDLLEIEFSPKKEKK